MEFILFGFLGCFLLAGIAIFCGYVSENNRTNIKGNNKNYTKEQAEILKKAGLWEKYGPKV